MPIESQNAFQHCKDKAFNEANSHRTAQSKNDIESSDSETSLFEGKILIQDTVIYG